MSFDLKEALLSIDAGEGAPLSILTVERSPSRGLCLAGENEKRPAALMAQPVFLKQAYTLGCNKQGGPLSIDEKQRSVSGAAHGLLEFGHIVHRLVIYL